MPISNILLLEQFKNNVNVKFDAIYVIRIAICIGVAGASFCIIFTVFVWFSPQLIDKRVIPAWLSTWSFNCTLSISTQNETKPG